MVVSNETSHLLPRSPDHLSSSNLHRPHPESPHTKHLPVSTNDFDVETKELGTSSCQLFKVSLLSLGHWLGRNCAVPFTLLMSAIGAGTLAVPYTFVLLSPIQAVSVLCCVGLAMGYTADILVDVHVSVAIETTTTFLSPQRIETYQHLAGKAGGKLLARFTGTLTAFAVFGACVGCICVVKDMAPTMLTAVMAHYYQRPLDEQQHAVVVAVWLVVLVLVLPLGCLTDISTLRYSSYFGVAFSLYLVGAVAYRALVGGGEAEADRVDAVASALERETPLFWRIAEVVGIYNFTFMLHLNVVPLLVQLEATETTRRQEACGENANGKAVAAVPILRYARRKMRCYLALAVGACVLLYATFGVCAAQIYGSQTRGNILLNLSSDRIMVVPRVAILLTILLSFPLLFHPLRSLVLEMIAVCTASKSEKESDEEQEQTHTLSQPVQASVTVLLLSAQILCALRVPGLQVVFSFVGASVLLMLCYLFPLVCYIRLAPWRSGRKERTRLVFLLILAVVAVVFCVAATLQLVVST
uniref:Amino acid transporter transmembrane domain-containing protein n=1 Tax=Hyaloperonospora arabidopsidis (strain Emoy2) TaxID=559515 RepID=M4C407_HYAAE